jgi:hypothetical protein
MSGRKARERAARDTGLNGLFVWMYVNRFPVNKHHCIAHTPQNHHTGTLAHSTPTGERGMLFVFGVIPMTRGTDAPRSVRYRWIRANTTITHR